MKKLFDSIYDDTLEVCEYLSTQRRSELLAIYEKAKVNYSTIQVAYGEGAIGDIITSIIEMIRNMWEDSADKKRMAEIDEELAEKSKAKLDNIRNTFVQIYNNRDNDSTTVINLNGAVAKKSNIVDQDTKHILTYLHSVGYEDEEKLLKIINAMESAKVDPKAIKNSLLCWAISEGFTASFKLFLNPAAAGNEYENDIAEKSLNTLDKFTKLLTIYMIAPIVMITMDADMITEKNNEQLEESYDDDKANTFDTSDENTSNTKAESKNIWKEYKKLFGIGESDNTNEKANGNNDSSSRGDNSNGDNINSNSNNGNNNNNANDNVNRNTNATNNVKVDENSKFYGVYKDSLNILNKVLNTKNLTKEVLNNATFNNTLKSTHDRMLNSVSHFKGGSFEYKSNKETFKEKEISVILQTSDAVRQLIRVCSTNIDKIMNVILETLDMAKETSVKYSVSRYKVNNNYKVVQQNGDVNEYKTDYEGKVDSTKNLIESTIDAVFKQNTMIGELFNNVASSKIILKRYLQKLNNTTKAINRVQGTNINDNGYNGPDKDKYKNVANKVNDANIDRSIQKNKDSKNINNLNINQAKSNANRKIAKKDKMVQNETTINNFNDDVYGRKSESYYNSIFENLLAYSEETQTVTNTTTINKQSGTNTYTTSGDSEFDNNKLKSDNVTRQAANKNYRPNMNTKSIEAIATDLSVLEKNASSVMNKLIELNLFNKEKLSFINKTPTPEEFINGKGAIAMSDMKHAKELDDDFLNKTTTDATNRIDATYKQLQSKDELTADDAKAVIALEYGLSLCIASISEPNISGRIVGKKTQKTVTKISNDYSKFMKNIDRKAKNSQNTEFIAQLSKTKKEEYLRELIANNEGIKDPKIIKKHMELLKSAGAASVANDYNTDDNKDDNNENGDNQ